MKIKRFSTAGWDAFARPGAPGLPSGRVSVPPCRAVPHNQFQFGLVSASAAWPSSGAGVGVGDVVASSACPTRSRAPAPGAKRTLQLLPLSGPRFPGNNEMGGGSLGPDLFHQTSCIS